jgi:hypothetical protein
MRHSKCFAVVGDDTKGETATVAPSEYPMKLQPHEAIVKLMASQKV